MTSLGSTPVRSRCRRRRSTLWHNASEPKRGRTPICVACVPSRISALCTVPGIGPVTAGAIAAFAPDLTTFSNGRNFAAWLGLVPRRHSSGGKTCLGRVSKMGQEDIRKLPIVGAMSRIRRICRRGEKIESWLGRHLARKPRMVAAVALANEMARVVWALVVREENHRTA